MQNNILLKTQLDQKLKIDQRAILSSKRGSQ